MNSNIDFVITWVDGNDRNWLEEKRKYNPDLTKVDDGESRFREWDLLKYWFRSVEKNAPWVRKIHFVTYGHLPKFLNVNHPKINIVKHEDYIPEQYLPTFSSHPIEMNMHRINDLSECFVYFNDDMYLNAPVCPEDFFKDGKPCLEAVEACIKATDINEVYQHIMLNNIAVINKNFSKRSVVKNNFFKWFNLKYGKDLVRNICLFPWGSFQNIINRHLPVPLLKSTFSKVWEAEYEVLDKTSSNKFRAITDVNPYLFRYWDIMTGNFVPKKQKGKAYHIGVDNTENLKNDIIHAKSKLICANDTSCVENFEKIKEEINDAFLMRYKEKSSFEL